MIPSFGYGYHNWQSIITDFIFSYNLQSTESIKSVILKILCVSKFLQNSWPFNFFGYEEHFDSCSCHFAWPISLERFAINSELIQIGKAWKQTSPHYFQRIALYLSYRIRKDFEIIDFFSSMRHHLAFNFLRLWNSHSFLALPILLKISFQAPRVSSHR